LSTSFCVFQIGFPAHTVVKPTRTAVNIACFSVQFKYHSILLVLPQPLAKMKPTSAALKQSTQREQLQAQGSEYTRPGLFSAWSIIIA